MDDNADIHALMREILTPERSKADAMADKLRGLEDDLFGTDDIQSSRPSPDDTPFAIDSAFQGEEAVELVRQMDAAPYFLAFVDMRMPPGIDGLQTIKRMWQCAPDLFVVICSAYSDHTWDEISREVGYSPNLLVLRKPFDAIEIRQIAAAVAKLYATLDLCRDTDERTASMLGEFQVALTTARARLETLVKAGGSAVLMVNASGAVEMASPRAAELLQRPPGEVINVPIDTLITVDQTPNALQTRTGHLLKDGRKLVPVTINSHPVRTDGSQTAEQFLVLHTFNAGVGG